MFLFSNAELNIADYFLKVITQRLQTLLLLIFMCATLCKNNRKHNNYDRRSGDTGDESEQNKGSGCGAAPRHRVILLLLRSGAWEHQHAD